MLLYPTLALCTTLVSAAKLTISIPSSPPLLPNPASLPPSTHAVLIGPPGVRYDMPIRKDNTFVFPDLTEASYLLTVHTRDYFFVPLRVDVERVGDGSQQETINAWQTFRGNEWSNKGPLYGYGKDELSVQIRPSGVKNFYQERGGFNILSFLKSPMILMALVSAVMIFGLPYLMDNSMSTNYPMRGTSCDDKLILEQWIRRRRQSLMRCKRKVVSRAAVVRRTSCKTSILPDFLLEEVLGQIAEVREAARSGNTPQFTKTRSV